MQILFKILGSQIDTPCEGYKNYYESYGYEFECNYENSESFTCDNCVVNCLQTYENKMYYDKNCYSPITGKRVNLITRIHMIFVASKYNRKRKIKHEIRKF